MKINGITLLSLIVTLLSGSTPAQNNRIPQIKGIIIDIETNEFINDVTVVLSISGDIVSSVSDGSFLFTGLTGFGINSNQPLKFSFFRKGYEPVRDTSLFLNTFGSIEKAIQLKKRRIAQTNQSSFQGFVKYNNEPISEVEVSYPRDTSGLVFTNKNGYFYIIVDKPAMADSTTFIFRKDGFKTLYTKISNAEGYLIKTHEIDLKSHELVFIGEIKDEEGLDVNNAYVELKIDTINRGTYTDKKGNYKISIDKNLIRSSNYAIEVNRTGNIPNERYSIIPQPNFIKNDFTLQNKEPAFGFVNPAKYVKERNNYPLSVGIGIGIQSGGSITLGNVPSEIRIIPPHPDDLEKRSNEILDPNVTDNYLIDTNKVFVNLPRKKSIDFNLSFYGLINIALRTADFSSSEENDGSNLFKKRYIKPEYYGDAFIYYTIKTQDQGFFSKNSFSLPISLNYPLVYFGKNPEINRRLIIRIVGGTNILLPPKIKLEAENGWDRYGSHEIHETKDLGEIKDIEWFWGFDFEGAISESFHFNAQLSFIYPDYKENFKTPMTFQFDKSSSASFNMGLSWLINAK